MPYLKALISITVLSIALGTLFWIPYGMLLWGDYPGELHRRWMLVGSAPLLLITALLKGYPRFAHQRQRYFWLAITSIIALAMSSTLAYYHYKPMHHGFVLSLCTAAVVILYPTIQWGPLQWFGGFISLISFLISGWLVTEVWGSLLMLMTTAGIWLAYPISTDSVLRRWCYHCALGLAILSEALIIWWPEQSLHFAHSIYMGSIAGVLAMCLPNWLLTQLSRKQLWILGGLLVIAAATRVSAPYIAGSYLRHLAYAAMLWAGVWWYVVWQLWQPKKPQPPSQP